MDTKPDTSNPKSILTAMALGMILAGVVVYLLQAQLGLPDDTARLVASLLLLVGVGDLVLVYFWDRLFGQR